MTPPSTLTLLFLSALCLIYAYFVFTTTPAQLSKISYGKYGLPPLPNGAGPVYIYSNPSINQTQTQKISTLVNDGVSSPEVNFNQTNQS